jgi:hypothetical protein
MTKARRSRSTGPLRAWAGDSLWRQFLAWMARTAVYLVLVAIVFGIIWFVLTPNMIDGIVNAFTNK